MKKLSQTQQAIVDARIREINEILNNSMGRMGEMLKQPQPNLKEITNELNNMAGNMSREINRRLLEMKSLVPAPRPTGVPAPAAADGQLIPGGLGEKPGSRRCRCQGTRSGH